MLLGEWVEVGTDLLPPRSKGDYCSPPPPPFSSLPIPCPSNPLPPNMEPCLLPRQHSSHTPYGVRTCSIQCMRVKGLTLICTSLGLKLFLKRRWVSRLRKTARILLGFILLYVKRNSRIVNKAFLWHVHIIFSPNLICVC